MELQIRSWKKSSLSLWLLSSDKTECIISLNKVGVQFLYIHINITYIVELVLWQSSPLEYFLQNIRMEIALSGKEYDFSQNTPFISWQKNITTCSIETLTWCNKPSISTIMEQI